MQSQSSNSEASVQCLSFSTYSTNSTAETAARVSREFEKLHVNSSGDCVADEDGDEEDFEFVSAGADVFFGGGGGTGGEGIGPVFPVFNRDLIISGGRLEIRGGDEEVSGPPSSSSSEADELDGVPEGTYCVWTPKCVPATPGRCEKSNSTGSTASTSASAARRWRFRDLLRRSRSDGKQSFVFLTPSFGSSKKAAVGEEQKPTAEKSRRSSGGSDRAGKGKDMAAAHEVFYVRNKVSERTAEKRRSTYLPYRQDLFGFFAGVNTVGRTFPPF